MSLQHSHHSEEHVETHTGNFEDNLKLRAEKLKETKAAIDKYLKDYDGELIVLVSAKAVDEKHGQTATLIAGVCSGNEQMNVIKGLRSATETLEKTLADSIEQVMKDDPLEALRQLLTSMPKSK